MNYYDDYRFLQKYSAELGNLADDFQVKGSCAQGLQTGKVQVASDGEKVIDASFYNAKGQVVDTRRLQTGKRLTCIHTDYSYTGKPTKMITNEYMLNNGNKILAVSTIQENEYSKKTDKLLSSTLSINGRKETIQKFDYDDLGRVRFITRGGNAGTVSYDYNLHGWTTNIDSRDFHEKLHYTDGVGTPCYNGNISSQLWSTSDYGQIRGYKFEYDGLDRLKEAVYGETPSLSDKQNRYNEKVIEYTANGAMKRFQRRGRKDNGEYGKIDNLNIKLNGNQLLSVTDDALPANKYSSFNFIDGANEQTEYEYNGVGALTKDLNRGITIKYDNLNNPRRIDFKDGNSITYTYMPDGTLIMKVYGDRQVSSKSKANVSAFDSLANVSGWIQPADSLFIDNIGIIVTGNTEYCGNIIYRNGKLNKVLFSGGYCTFNKERNNEPVFHYFTQDHLGNNRIVTNEDGTVEQITHYYPFGGTFNEAGLNASLQQYKYNGKELDRIAGQNTYDYGARQYFSALPMWNGVDPLFEKHYELSPYILCGNNPVTRIEKDGKDWYYSKNGDFIGSDFNFSDNIIIREFNIRALGNAIWQKGQSKFIDTNIAKTKLPVRAYSKIFSHILNKNGFDMNLLKSGKIEVYETDGLNFYDKTENAEKSYESNAVTTHYKDGSANITAFINTSYNGTQELYSTVSNVVNILGGHEFYVHLLLKGNEKIAYNIQRIIPSWEKTTEQLKQHVKEMIKNYEK